MQLVNADRQLVIKFVQGAPFFLIIESVNELRKVVDDFILSTEDGTDTWILSEGEEILKKDSLIEFIFSPWTIDVNQKKIQKALLSTVIKMIRQGVEEEHAQSILKEMNIMLGNINIEMGCDFDYTADDITVILKGCDIRFIPEEDILIRISQYIKICSEFLNTKLFVFCGARSWLTSEELDILAKEAGYLECWVLCIENFSDGSEKNMILVDKDLCWVI